MITEMMVVTVRKKSDFLWKFAGHNNKFTKCSRGKFIVLSWNFEFAFL